MNGHVVGTESTILERVRTNFISSYSFNYKPWSHVIRYRDLVTYSFPVVWCMLARTLLIVYFKLHVGIFVALITYSFLVLNTL